MRKVFTLIGLLVSMWATAQPTVVISQVYGGGGNASATFNQDFVELYNTGTVAVDISGWSIQYASATGPGGIGNWLVGSIPASTTIAPGKYYLIALATGANGVPLPTADLVITTGINLSATAGKVALVNSTTALNGTTACSNVSVRDVIGYGGTATCSETASFIPTGIDNTKSIVRKLKGCTDTNNNLTDFEVLLVAPRNSASPANVCGTVPVTPTLTASTVADFGNVTVATQSVSKTFTLSGENLTGSPGTITVTAPSTDFQVSSDNITWGPTATVLYTSATLASTTLYVRFTPQTAGAKTGNVTITGGGATATVAVSGNGIAPATPTLTASAVADFGNVTVATQSASKTFTVSGQNLTGFPGAITVTAPSTDFQVSSDNIVWGPTATVLYTSATLASTILYVRFTPQTAGAKTGNVTITGGGATATVAVSGNGIAPPPLAPVAIAATNITSTGFTANWITVVGATEYFLDVYTLTFPGNIIAGWDFGTNDATSQKANLGNTTNKDIATINGVNINTVSWPSGPGTPNTYSLSANGWDNGIDTKYWETIINTIGVTNITVSSRQYGSNTGPQNFKVQYKIGASGTWTDVAGGVLQVANNWNNANLSNLVLPATCDNQTAVHLRWVCTSTTAINGSNVAATGTSRLSAVYVNGSTVGSGAGTPVYVHQNLSVGNVTSYAVTGLNPNTKYYYVVRAANANGSSGNSNEIMLTTLPPPKLTATPLAPFGNICVGSTSSAHSFTITGENITNQPITVGPLSGYSFAITEGGSYSATLVITQTGGNQSIPVFVKFMPTAEQSYNGNILVSGGGAVPITVAASGSGGNVPAQLLTGAASNLTTYSAMLSGSLTVEGCTPATAFGIEYSGIDGFAGGSGTQVASRSGNASGFSALATGLTQGLTYYYRAYSVNGNGVSYGQQASFTLPTIADGLQVYPNPVVRGSMIRVSKGDLHPGYYGLQLIAADGKIVFQLNMNIQSTFINQSVTIPATLATGAYVVRLVDNENVLVARWIIVNQ